MDESIDCIIFPGEMRLIRGVVVNAGASLAQYFPITDREVSATLAMHASE